MTENLKKFIYDETKTAKEMAATSGLTVKQVQNRLQRLGYSHRQEKEKKNFEKVRNFFKEHPDATPTEAAKETHLSRPTVYKFMAMGESYTPSGSSKQSVPKCLSISDNLNKTLKNIIRLHLPQSNTFDCDLTYGEGGFYRKGIPVPEHIFDLFDYGCVTPAGTIVEKLDFKNPAEIKVDSVMVDLPVEINEENFSTATELYEAYESYIEFASLILNPGGVLVFSTADFILWDDNDNTWATDFAISVALEQGFSLKDKIHLVRKGGNITIDGVTVKSGLKDSAFLIFKKN